MPEILNPISIPEKTYCSILKRDLFRKDIVQKTHLFPEVCPDLI